MRKKGTVDERITECFRGLTLEYPPEEVIAEALRCITRIVLQVKHPLSQDFDVIMQLASIMKRCFDEERPEWERVIH